MRPFDQSDKISKIFINSYWKVVISILKGEIKMTIQNLGAPKGMTKMGDLYVSEDLKEAAGSLNSENKKLLNLKKDLQVDSLQGTIMHALLSAGKSKTDNGGSTYDVSRVGRERFMNIVMEKLSYHVHVTHFGIQEDEAKKLASYTDLNGEKYSDLVVTATVGVDKTSLENLLEEDMIDNQTAFQTAARIGHSYLSIQTSNKLKSTYKGEASLPKMKDDLKNLGEAFKLSPEVFKVKDLERMFDEREINQLYVQGLNKAWSMVN